MSEQLGYCPRDIAAAHKAVEAYRARTPIPQIEMDVGYATASLFRVFNWAEAMGFLSPEERRGPGGRIDRGRIFEVMALFPQATIAQVAQLAGCSEATVFRAKRESEGANVLEEMAAA